MVKEEGTNDHFDLELDDAPPTPNPSPISSLTSLSSSETTPNQPAKRKRGRGKAFSKIMRKKQRVENKSPDDNPSIQPYMIRNHVKSAQAREVPVSLEHDAAVASTGYTGLQNQPDSDAVDLEDLKDFEYIQWDGTCVNLNP